MRSIGSTMGFLDWFFGQSAFVQIITVGLVAVPVIWFSVSAWLNAEEMETGARDTMMASCTPKHGQDVCEGWMEANHKPCYKTSHKGGGRFSRAYVDHGEYSFCLQYGEEKLRERRREQWKQSPY